MEGGIEDGRGEDGVREREEDRNEIQKEGYICQAFLNTNPQLEECLKQINAC